MKYNFMLFGDEFSCYRPMHSSELPIEFHFILMQFFSRNGIQPYIYFKILFSIVSYHNLLHAWEGVWVNLGRRDRMCETSGLVLYGELRLVLLTQTKSTSVINGAYTFGLSILCGIWNSKPSTNEISLTESLREWICAAFQNVASYSSCL